LIKENLTEPMKMEIFTAGADGSDVAQLTHFGCASFAPTFTPDGKRILFSSNKQDCDGRHFELFLMNADGSKVQQATNFGRICFIRRVLARRQANRICQRLEGGRTL